MTLQLLRNTVDKTIADYEQQEGDYRSIGKVALASLQQAQFALNQFPPKGISLLEQLSGLSPVSEFRHWDERIYGAFYNPITQEINIKETREGQ